MNSTTNYKIVIGLLVALLIALNVVVPYVKNKQEESKGVAALELMKSIAGKTSDEQNAAAKDYVAGQGKSFAMSADASYDATLCSIWTSIYQSISNGPILRKYGSLQAWNEAVDNAQDHMVDYCNREPGEIILQ